MNNRRTDIFERIAGWLVKCIILGHLTAVYQQRRLFVEFLLKISAPDSSTYLACRSLVAVLFL